jgi:hypothetical protein
MLGIIVHWWRSRSEWREAKARSPQITGVGFVTFGLAVAAFRWNRHVETGAGELPGILD